MLPEGFITTVPNNNIFLYWPDCTGLTDCEAVHFIAAEDDPLDNDIQNFF